MSIVAGTPMPNPSDLSAVLARWSELTDLFEGCHLSLRISRAASLVGLRSKEALRRELAFRRLPPFQLLRDWCYTVRLAERFAVDEALAEWALRRGDDPASYYKLVRKTTGHSWSDVRAKGPQWASTMARLVWTPHL